MYEPKTRVTDRKIARKRTEKREIKHALLTIVYVEEAVDVSRIQMIRMGDIERIAHCIQLDPVSL